ncbi:MAG: hypothetical protein ACRDE7_02970, partial [Sphingobacterium sp.]
MRPIWKWVIGVFAVLLIALLVGSWYLSRNWKPMVETKLKETVKESTSGLYELKYDNLDLNVALGNVTLVGAELIPDSNVYRQMVQQQTAPNSQFHIKLAALNIKRFSLWDVLMNRRLYIKNISFDSPEVHMISERHPFQDSTRKKAPKSLYDNIKDVFSSINVRNVEMENIKFKFTKIENGKSSDLQVDSVRLKLQDILVDQTSIHDSTRIYFTKLVEIKVPGFEYNLSGGIYKAKFDQLLINTQEENVLLTNVEYSPRMSKSEYFRQRNENKTMVVMKFDTLRFEKLDFKQLIDNQQTIAQHVQIKDGSISLYNDKRYPKKVVSKIGRAPHQMLMKVKQLIKLDSVLLNNIDILYGERSAKYNEEGVITFTGASGTLSNVTNDSLSLINNKILQANLQAHVMGTGLLKLNMGLDMLSKDGAHTYKGSLGRMKATDFNRILEPLLKVKISSGNIRKISFNIQANDYKSTGDFRFDYDHLKLNLENLLAPDANKTKKGVLSFLVNRILINESNPDPNEVYHVGKVNYTRVPSHSFFKNMWQSLLDGIKQCAGISKEREASLMGKADGAKEAVEESKGILKKTGKFLNGIFK